VLSGYLPGKMDENHRKPQDIEFTGKDFNLVYPEY